MVKYPNFLLKGPWILPPDVRLPAPACSSLPLLFYLPSPLFSLFLSQIHQNLCHPTTRRGAAYRNMTVVPKVFPYRPSG